MKTIIAEKPSVAMGIARIVGANEKGDGFMTGNGYYVTWAFGHLIQLCMPEAYGFKGFDRANLPIMPDTFLLQPRQVKDGKEYKTDAGVAKQIKVIEGLFNKSEKIIVATDAGREGELIFRYLYYHLGCKVPFDRLWISSLTDAAIKEGMRNLRNGRDYDNLYLAAKARSEADWLVGINGTQALSIAAGKGTYSVGRVQTPTLAMVCERYLENKKFQSVPFWQVAFTVKEVEEQTLKFTSNEKWQTKEPASAIYNKVNGSRQATITKVEKKIANQEPPLLYDLTTLQKEANSKHNLTAEQTLQIAQKLYESKLITYPRTSSRYISEDVYDTVPKLLSTQRDHPMFGVEVRAITKPTKRSVDASKVTDHHALLITGNAPTGISGSERTIYDMILGRMVEAFSERCVSEKTTVTATSGGAEFVIKGSVIKQAGWRAVFKTKDEEPLLPSWTEGQTLTLDSCELVEGHTKPKPLHTESSLLAAMETAGKDIENEEMRQAIKDCGIGTPATRASIIETLLKREYMRREKKSLVPTDKGLALYDVVKDMNISNVEMTGNWEAELAKIEQGKVSSDQFMLAIKGYTRKITSEMLQCEKIASSAQQAASAGLCKCPKCHTGNMHIYAKVAKCDNPDCGLPIFRQIAGKTLTDSQMTTLLSRGRTGVIKGFTSKAGKTFDASITFDDDYRTKFVFTDNKNKKRR